MDHRRNIPPFAPRTFRHWFKHNVTTNAEATTGDEVILFVDSFTNYFTPKVGIATVRVLQNAGYRPTLTAKQQCCGLTWISTGQLDAARRTLDRTINVLAPSSAMRGVPIVGMEPPVPPSYVPRPPN